MSAPIVNIPILPAEAGSQSANPPTYPGESNMTARDERMTILRMVEEGKVTPEEGAKLLAAVGEGSARSSAAPATQAKSSFDETSVLRIRVTDLVTGQQKVNVNLPVGFVRFGLRFVPESANVDVPSILAAFDSGMRGRIVDVTADEEGKRVEIFIE